MKRQQTSGLPLKNGDALENIQRFVELVVFCNGGRLFAVGLAGVVLAVFEVAGEVGFGNRCSLLDQFDLRGFDHDIGNDAAGLNGVSRGCEVARRVSLMALSSRSGSTVCTEPLPKLWVPITMPRLLS